ncbi:FAD-dependent urate hydroxylase [Actinocorallia herbida]|uniref:FAD-dependent urate hydroxylase n=1 Tax=Actinocorallia herbida TaxID=58109 RepID=A0A3N1CU25_9ACTN|nr:NAD(P)/FAD-dependent oxidoreductase [Actinocorallia herbida]ROO84811.1 FAD-dependent urate hydroxylase [Actinocorallia herbida]
MRVLVVGAGIGGMAAARGLAAAGHDVTVLERAGGLRLGGGAITLWCNGTGILGDLGVDLSGTGRRLEALALRTPRGRQVADVDMAAVGARLGSAARVVPRGALLTLLADGLPDGTVRFGARVADVHLDRDAVRVRTDDGGVHEADFLVGADGLRSRVRAEVLGGGPAAATGVVGWQGLTPAPLDFGGTSTMVIGRHGDCGFMSAGGGLMQWFFDGPPAPADRSALDVLRARYAGWAEPIPTILASLAEADVEVHPQFRHTVPRRWGTGRCVLLGDAAHVMPPAVALGANQALEDVAALLGCLAAADAPRGVAEAYSARRRAKAARASAVASGALAVSGPRTLLQTERLIGAATVPGRLATAVVERLIRAVSSRY